MAGKTNSESGATEDFELANAPELAKIVGVNTATINRYFERKVLTQYSVHPTETGKRGGRLFIISNALEEIKKNLNGHSFLAGKATPVKNPKANAASKPASSKKTTREKEIDGKKVKIETGPRLDNNLDRYNLAKAEREEINVKLQRQKLDEQSKKLMDVERVKKTVYSYNSRVREAILNIPDQLGPELYASKSLFQLQERLRKGLNQALSNLEKLDTRLNRLSDDT